MSEVLTKADLVEITGAKQTTKQGEILAKAGIHWWKRLDGSICTDWYHVHNPKTIDSVNMPDYSWIDGA